ncbi:acyl-CoA 6-desaturase-like [Lineus longissimus]|uniref:acyl-CoA 6-desaturase-like n=1 Tax=Lineus longissimus TaxID=88925 RepID=UPI002B4E1778
MGKGSKSNRVIPWDEVSKHDKRDDKWLVINDEVFDVTAWSKRHPGGSRIIGHFAGQDATEPFHAFHNDVKQVSKYLTAIKVGDLPVQEAKQRSTIDEDFDKMRETAKKMGLFEASYFFFFVMLAHIFIMEVLAYLTMAYFGTGWLPYLVSVALYSTVQAQAGWLQHDFGHLSVFKDSKLDHFVHQLTMSFSKGASAKWWNHMHFQHHAKPNVIGLDPDVRVEQLFVIGDVMPIKVAKESKKSMPYNFQHRYFFFLGPPLLFPIYFQFMTFRHVITRRCWVDGFFMALFFFKFFYLYSPLLGFWGSLAYFFIIRCAESHWFTWVSQSNHIPMSIEHDTAKPWLALQTSATCDIEKSFFNDWFTGHLNFQIEHHCFPTMPRHNYYKVAPLVKSLCEKHGIKYEVKPLWTALKDIVKSLKHSGELWQMTYDAYHLD